MKKFLRWLFKPHSHAMTGETMLRRAIRDPSFSTVELLELERTLTARRDLAATPKSVYTSGSASGGEDACGADR
jgi:hypothetical protein